MEGRKKILSEHAQHARHEEEIERGIAPPLGEGELLTPDYQVLAHLSRSRLFDVYDV
jgi:hypothetical protein